MRGQGIDSDHLGKGRFELHIDRRTGGQCLAIVEFGPRFAEIQPFINRILSVRDAINLNHWEIVTAGVETWELPKRTFGLAPAAQNAPLENIFGAPRYIEPLLGFHDSVWLTLHRRRHLVFPLVVQDRHRTHQQDNRFVADGNGNRQILPALLGVPQMDSNIVLRNWLNVEFVAALHLHSVDPDILYIVVVPVVGVAADDACLIEEEAAVASVESEKRHQMEQIHVFIDDNLLPGSTVYPLYFARILLIPARKFEKLLSYRRILVHSQQERMIRPGAVYIHDDLGIGVAVDVVEL